MDDQQISRYKNGYGVQDGAQLLPCIDTMNTLSLLGNHLLFQLV